MRAEDAGRPGRRREEEEEEEGRDGRTRPGLGHASPGIPSASPPHPAPASPVGVLFRPRVPREAALPSCLPSLSGRRRCHNTRAALR